ncbi:rhomboid family intramembrane serine protease [Bacteroidia bacterium]|nr:rhomboid family intramembrane serine protease [Bacteroidia bacterium]GHT45305.1 rhomboid family intramembrane serine protease [Bacteroidia bacterium]
MATVFSNIERFFKQKSVLSTLLIINLLVFLLIKVVGVFFLLFKISPVPLIAFFELPASLTQLAYRPWTLISYMFTHLGFWHIVFNLLWLYWFGQIFLRFFGPKQLGGLYVLGGIVGGLLFVLSYNLFPYFRDSIDHSYLIGASASVMAIVFATAFYKKDYEISLLFLGNIKLIYIAGFFFILDLVSIESDNPGGHIAHIGGALMGIWFANAFLKGKDLTSGINFVLDKIANLFTKRERKPSFTKIYGRPETDQEYNKRKSEQNNEIDRILDKIKRSGYNSLSENEKKTLFNASK